MQTKPYTLFSRFVSLRATSLCALVVGLMIASPATAEPIAVVAGDDPAVPSAFTLNFGDAGTVASARVALTDVEFQVDPDQGEARFVRYYQEVEPLTLPGGISTGNLTIRILDGSSAGTFDELTGVFETEEVYEIHFEGDLSAFGLESPVLLPSSSSGVLNLAPDEGGQIAMSWLGDGVLANPVDPLMPLEFSYTCTVNAAFAPTPAMLVRLSLVPQVARLELNRGLENGLEAKLFGALDHLNAGHARAAGRLLGAFVRSVDALSGRHIDPDAAAVLSSSALAVLDVISVQHASRSGLVGSAGKGNGARR